MQSDVPLRFLVGASRLISVYFVLRAMDTAASVIMTYQFQLNASPEIAAGMPSVWSLYIPALVAYMSLVLLTWFGAPALCRLAVRSRTAANESPVIHVSINETMIFLVGVLMMGWGLVRFGEDASRLFRPKALPSQVTGLDAYTQVRLFSTLILACGGGMMMARFAAIHRWIQKRKQEDQ